jgi:hypothetical protein
MQKRASLSERIYGVYVEGLEKSSQVFVGSLISSSEPSNFVKALLRKCATISFLCQVVLIP